MDKLVAAADDVVVEIHVEELVPLPGLRDAMQDVQPGYRVVRHIWFDARLT
jgi:hypothetical protein